MAVKKPPVPTQKEIFSGKIDPIIKSNVISKNNDNYKDLRIGLYDIDSCLQYYFDNIIKPTVLENDVQILVPSMYGSPERWASVQKDGYFRDKNGKIHCPVILFKRVGMSKDRNLSRNLDANFPRISKTFTKQYSSQNRYDAFSKLTNIKPTYEQHNIIIPDYVKLTYDCMIWTDYLVQLDKITEAISYAESSYWGDPEKFVFYATVSDFNNQTEVSDGQDRMVRCNFTINLNGYIISDALQKQLKEHSKNYTIQTLKLIESGFIPESDVSRPAVEPTVSSGGGNAYSRENAHAQYADFALSSSYAILAETASYIDTLYSSNHIGIFNDTDTWIVNHNLGTRFVIIQAFDSNYEQIIPSTIELTSTSSAKMTFPSNESGYSVTTVGGALGVVNVLSASFSDVATYAYRYDKPERRHDWQSPYSYMGYATHGTSVSESTWDLTRIEVYGAGTTDVKYATDSWNNHLIAIYN